MPPDDPEIARRIDRLCREFESDWGLASPLDRGAAGQGRGLRTRTPARRADRPRTRTPRQPGQPADREDYQARFPQLGGRRSRLRHLVHRSAPEPDPLEAPTSRRPARRHRGHRGRDNPASERQDPRRPPIRSVDLTPRSRPNPTRRPTSGNHRKAADPALGTVRYFGDYELLRRSPEAAWASSTGPGRSASTGPWPSR